MSLEDEWNEKSPAFLLFVRDWLTDINLRRCSRAARSVWIDALCAMWLAPVRGKLEAGTRAELCDMLCDSEEAISHLIDELVDKKVALADGPGVLISKRMFRQAKLKQTRSKAGSKGGSVSASKRQTISTAHNGCLSKEPSKEASKKEAKTPPSSSSSYSSSINTGGNPSTSREGEPPVLSEKDFRISEEEFELLCGEFGPKVVNHYKKVCINNLIQKGTRTESLFRYMQNWILKDRTEKRGMYAPSAAPSETAGVLPAYQVRKADPNDRLQFARGEKKSKNHTGPLALELGGENGDLLSKAPGAPSGKPEGRREEVEPDE